MARGGRYNTGPEDIARIIADLEKRVRDLESGNRIGNTSVDKGALNIRSGELAVGNVVFFGPVSMGPDTSPGWIFYRGDGTPVFVLEGSDALDQFWGFFDNQGNLILGDDAVSNMGLARPWLPVPFVDSTTTSFPTATTTSGSFVGLLTARMYKQHPKLVADVLVRSSDGTTTGEVQIAQANTGIVIAGPITVTAAMYSGVTLGPATFPGGFGEDVEIEVQARRTAGAGTIGVRMLGAYACQS